MQHVILKTESQKDGVNYDIYERNEAEELIRRNYKWKHQFEIIGDVTHAIQKFQRDKNNSLEIADIRNKLSPIVNLVALVETDVKLDDDYIQRAINQAKESINYLAKREVYPASNL